MSSNILVFCEHTQGSFLKTAYELLSKAKELASGGVVSAVVVGEADVSSLKGFGADKIYTSAGEGFLGHNTSIATRVIQAAAAAAQPSLILGAAGANTREIFPRLAIRLNAGFCPEVVELKSEDGVFVGTRPSFTGKVLNDVKITSSTAIITARPNAFSVVESAGAGDVEALSVDIEESDRACVVSSIEASQAQYVDLTEADRIVSGGRSVKSKESFDSLIRPLAEVLGATPGASRAAVDSGFAEHSEQVGQTGKIVNPSLYIACGISGAIQHLAGMRTSRIIVAINRDKDAPIFSHATYGIVADMFDICPELTNVLKAESSGQPLKPKPAAAAAAVSTETKTTEAVAAPSEAKATTEEASAPAESTTTAEPEKKATTAVATAAVGHAVAAFDPAVLDGLKAQIDGLKDQVHQLSKELVTTKSALEKSTQSTVSNSAKSLKSDFDRAEKNARAFQEGASRSVQKIDKTVEAEVRKVRETLRKGIANDTQDLREGMIGLRNAAVASAVMSGLAIALLIFVLIKLGSI